MLQKQAYEIQTTLSRNLERLNEAIDQNFLLSNPTFQLLRNYTNFNEIRIHCWKAYHNRVQDVVITDGQTEESTELFNYVLGYSTYDRSNLCQAFRRLSDDTSLMSQKSCTDYSPQS